MQVMRKLPEPPIPWEASEGVDSEAGTDSEGEGVSAAEEAALALICRAGVVAAGVFAAGVLAAGVFAAGVLAAGVLAAGVGEAAGEASGVDAAPEAAAGAEALPAALDPAGASPEGLSVPIVSSPGFGNTTSWPSMVVLPLPTLAT